MVEERLYRLPNVLFCFVIPMTLWVVVIIII